MTQRSVIISKATNRPATSGCLAKMTAPFSQAGGKTFSRRKDFSAVKRFVFFFDCEPRQHLVAWDRPIHRNRVTPMSWADHSKRSGTAGAANYHDPVAINDLAASQTVTFVVERIPLPITIEPLQNFKLFSVRELDGRKERRHRANNEQSGFRQQSDQRQIGP